MDLRLRRARRDWLSQGDLRSGIRALEAEGLSPLETLRHPWLENAELRLAYGAHLASRGEALGEWIAASTRLAKPMGLSVEAEWRLRHRAWRLLDTYGEEWSEGRRHNHCEFLRDRNHPWRLEAGRLTPCAWTLRAPALNESDPPELRARGLPGVKLERPYELENLATWFSSVSWFSEVRELTFDCHGSWSWDEEESLGGGELPAEREDFDLEAEVAASQRERREAEPPIDLDSLLSHLTSLRRLKLIGDDFLPAWVRALPENLRSLEWYADAQVLAELLQRTWPALESLELGAPWINARHAKESIVDTIEPARLPRLEALTLLGFVPPRLDALAPQLRSLSLSAPSDMYFGGAPPTVPWLLGPALEGQFTRLEDLRIQLHRTGAKFQAFLARLPRLRSLHLSNTGLDDKEAATLARYRGLRELTIGHAQPLTGKGLAKLLEGPLARSLRSLDIRGGHGCCGPGRSHYPLGGAETLRSAPNHRLTSLSLPYLTRRSARVLATAPALRGLCELRVGDLRDDPAAIHAALTQRTIFRLTSFAVDSPKSPDEEETLCALWGSRYIRKPDLVFFNF